MVELNLIALPRGWPPRGRMKAEQVGSEVGTIKGREWMHSLAVL